METVNLKFIKYQGAGNDFIMLDGIEEAFVIDQLTTQVVEKLCDRHFGIGADGLIVLQAHKDYDFEMVYYNSDGRLSSMCGNGGRCIIHMAHALGYTGKECEFIAADGPHKGRVGESNVSLQMGDVSEIQALSETDFFLDTGSPHYVRFIDGPLETLDIVSMAREIRYNETYKKQGTNVNFARITAPGQLEIRTYERGVEDETLACGTGITAASLAYDHMHRLTTEINVTAVGGQLRVKHEKSLGGWQNVWLEGPAEVVFSGEITV